MKFAYADPPYFGVAGKFYGHLHAEAAVYDTLDGHKALIERLSDEYADGWGLSMTSGNLHDILPLCPRGARIMPWVKPFASFKPGLMRSYSNGFYTRAQSLAEQLPIQCGRITAR